MSTIATGQNEKDRVIGRPGEGVKALRYSPSPDFPVSPSAPQKPRCPKVYMSTFIGRASAAFKAILY